jgi:DNA-binding SARP family transcriptional activator
VRATDWDAATQVLIAHAPRLLKQQRSQMLMSWLSQLPAAEILARPWLAYWHSMALLQNDPRSGRIAMQTVSAEFERRGDTAGQVAAATAVIQSHLFDLDDIDAIDPWLALVERFLAAQPTFAEPQAELQVLTAYGAALLFRAPAHPHLELCCRRLVELLALRLDSGMRVTAASFLLFKCGWLADVEQCASVIPQVGALLNDPQVSAGELAIWWWWRAQISLLTESRQTALATIEKLLSIVAENGLAYVGAYVQLCRAVGLLMYARVSSADAILRAAERSLPLLSTRDLALFHYLRATVAFERNDLVTAEGHGREAVAFARRTRVVLPISLCLRGLALILAERGCSDEAESCAQESVAQLPATPRMAFETHLLKAYLALRRSDPSRARRELEEAPAAGRRIGFLNSVHWFPSVILRLTAFALEEGVQVDHFRALARTLELAAPSANIEGWPWPVRIRTLGTFSVIIGDEPLRFSAKVQKKPLELLKAVIALGGTRVPERKLTEILWPGAEADAAAQALASTLHRLRHLVGEESVERHEGRLSLNGQRCHVDVWALEAHLKDLQAACARKDADAIRLVGERALSLYNGGFLEAEHDEPWVLGACEALRARFCRHLTAAARLLAEAHDHERAIEWYLKALDVEPLSETLYVGLMRSYDATHRPSDALLVFRRCRERLRAELRVEPAAETVRLAEAIRSRSVPDR